jgi:predicted esterase YcpF (UPF0227 family)
VPATPALVYIHGFNSSPQSAKARLVGADLVARNPAIPYVVPALPAAPGGEAIRVLEAVLQKLTGDGYAPVLIGSSLGGFYAAWLAEQHGLRAVLVNPVVRPHELFAPHLGEQLNTYTGERYQLTQRHVDELRMLALPRVSRPQDFLVLLQTGDETLDWRDAWTLYGDCSVLKQLGGSHGYEGFEDVLPLIYRFAGL